MSPKNFTQPDYHPLPSVPSDGLQGLFNMVHSFLDLVQPNEFPADFLTRLIKHEVNINSSQGYKEVLTYETGYLVCLVIGLLFIILMPLVGFCFCCCRCCGHCGGFMYQKQTKNMDCKRKTLFASLLGVTMILSAGVICALISNQRITQTVRRGFSTLNDTRDNLHLYLNSIPQEIDDIISSISVPINKVNNSLMDIGDHLGEKIKAQLGGQAYSALNSTEQLLRVISSVKQELHTVNQSAHQLQYLQKELEKKLSTVRDNINKTLKDCGEPCQKVSVNNLKPGANLSTIPDVEEPLHLIENMSISDLNATIMKVTLPFFWALLSPLTPQMGHVECPFQVLRWSAWEKLCSRSRLMSFAIFLVMFILWGSGGGLVAALQCLLEAQDKLQDVKKQTNDIHTVFPIRSSLENISEFMDDIVKKADSYEPAVATYDGYRWIVGICFCCLVLLIILCNLLGLLFGACGLDPKKMPISRGCLSNSGGNFLMASAGFSFLFAWLLMLLVGLMFFVGGNTYTLVCRPWANGHLLEFLSTPGVIPQFNLTRILQLKNSSVTLSSLYKSCEKNASLWSTLQMDDFVSLDKILNISEYTGDINSTLEKINISVSFTEVLNEDQKKSIQDLSKKDGPLHLNFTPVEEQMKQDIIKQDLSALANELRNLSTKTVSGARTGYPHSPTVLFSPNFLLNGTFAESLQGENKTSTQLQKQAEELNKIETWVNDSFPKEIVSADSPTPSVLPPGISPGLEVLSSSIQKLQNKSSQIPLSLTCVHSDVLGCNTSHSQPAWPFGEPQVREGCALQGPVLAFMSMLIPYVIGLWHELANSTLTQIEDAEKFLNLRTKEVITNETSVFVHSMVGFFQTYLDWAKKIIKGQVGRCGPAAWAVDSVNIIFCSYMVNFVNAFWFSLGWCTVFLLPSIIIAVRLAKFYRRMFMDDFYDIFTFLDPLLSPPSWSFLSLRSPLSFFHPCCFHPPASLLIWCSIPLIPTITSAAVSASYLTHFSCYSTPCFPAAEHGRAVKVLVDTRAPAGTILLTPDYTFLLLCGVC
ncbi:Prominin-1-A [Varanus komodoensis]|nr:Prominin-1-A [Varanus komodoensis]